MFDIYIYFLILYLAINLPLYFIIIFYQVFLLFSCSSHMVWLWDVLLVVFYILFIFFFAALNVYCFELILILRDNCRLTGLIFRIFFFTIDFSSNVIWFFFYIKKNSFWINNWVRCLSLSFVICVYLFWLISNPKRCVNNRNLWFVLSDWKCLGYRNIIFPIYLINIIK